VEGSSSELYNYISSNAAKTQFSSYPFHTNEEQSVVVKQFSRLTVIGKSFVEFSNRRIDGDVGSFELGF